MPIVMTKTYSTGTGDPNNLNIGDPFGGGFYAGKMSIDGSIYAIICSPNANNVNGRDHKTSNTTDGVAAQSVNDGWTTTEANNNAAHPMAQYVRSLSVGGFTDWYIPSRDEMELIYRNLGNMAALRSTQTRSPSGQLGDAAGSIGSGDNRNSVPTRQAYSIEFKDATPKTPVTFTPGVTTVYLTSTETTANGGQIYGMFTSTTNTGSQSSWSKSGVGGNGNFLCRPIRRIKL